MSQAGIINVIDNNPSIPIFFEGDTGFAVALFNVIKIVGTGGIATSASGNTVTIDGSAITSNLTLTGNTGGPLSPTGDNFNILGASSAAGTIPVQVNGSVSTLTINVQKSAAISSTNATRVGLSAFNSTSFGVDANGFVSLNASASGVVTINGDSGSITGNVVTIFANVAANNCGSTVKFVNSGTTSTLNVTDSLSNVFIGSGAGNASVSGANNSGQGHLALASLSSGDSNCALGSTSLTNLTTGTNNCAVGVIALQNLVSGNNCIGIGHAAGQAYTTSESNNICIGASVTGTIGESNVTRIGNTSAAACFINGISGVTTSNTNMVTINTVTGQLGSTATLASFSQINMQTITSSGTYTPTTGMKYCVIEIVGGGGGGGGVPGGITTAAAGAGGGGGGYARAAFSAATIGASQTVTIGAGGTAGVSGSGSTGGTGGTTSVGALISMIGGTGGSNVTTSSAVGISIGGSGGGGGGFSSKFIAAGGSGANGLWAITPGFAVAGGGGGGGLGSGNTVQSSLSGAGGVTVGLNGTAFGGGGAGGISMLSASAADGGAGAQGYVVITEYI